MESRIIPFQMHAHVRYFFNGKVDKLMVIPI